MKGLSVLSIGMVAVFIAVFTLFFIFDQITKFGNSCVATSNADALCSQFTGFTQSLIIILLIISGFVIIITATAYILLSY